MRRVVAGGAEEASGANAGHGTKACDPRGVMGRVVGGGAEEASGASAGHGTKACDPRRGQMLFGVVVVHALELRLRFGLSDVSDASGGFLASGQEGSDPPIV